MSNNILTETLSMMSTMNNVEQSTNLNKTQNRHDPQDRYYLAPEKKANLIQIRPAPFPP